MLAPATALGRSALAPLAAEPVLAGTFSFGTEELTLADPTLFAGVPLCMQQTPLVMLAHCMIF